MLQMRRGLKTRRSLSMFSFVESSRR